MEAFIPVVFRVDGNCLQVAVRALEKTPRVQMLSFRLIWFLKRDAMPLNVRSAVGSWWIIAAWRVACGCGRIPGQSV